MPQVWLLLEEKQIPYRMEKINMRSYGDKPQEFLQKVPSGLLPVVELDGRPITESLDIMMILERVCTALMLYQPPFLETMKNSIDYVLTMRERQH
jgi:glutathione S-transferase